MEKTPTKQNPSECKHCKIEEAALATFYHCMKYDFLFCKPIDYPDYEPKEKKDKKITNERNERTSTKYFALSKLITTFVAV